MADLPDPHLLDELMPLAVRAAREAGAELMRRYGFIQGLSSKSSVTDPVSDADRAAERVVVDLINERRPQDGLLGEEGAARETESGITWVIDPLDGTVNYLYQLDNFSVSVAAEDEDGAVVGVVYDPTRDVIYSAARGRGAHRGSEQLHCAPDVPAAEALLATGFGYDPERRRRQGALIGRVLPQIRDVRRIGSAALDLSWLAAGMVNAYYEEGVNLWDVSAGGLIATEAGARVTVFTPLGLPYGILAAPAGLHAELSDRITASAEAVLAS